LASVDAENCYDRIAHAISNMIFQAFGTPDTAAESMHTAIQEMQFFFAQHLETQKNLWVLE
jgi:hypothetical protein